MIKRILQIGVILAGSIAMPSWAVMVGTTDVGAIDQLLATDVQQGNPTAETTWVNSILAAQTPPTSTNYTVKIEPANGVPILATDTANVFAFDMSPNAPDYFLVKNSTYVALYSNNLDLNWGVFDASALGSEFNLPGDYTISHVTLFGEGGNGVPEPGVLGLLGIGLLGIIVGRRRMAA